MTTNARKIKTLLPNGTEVDTTRWMHTNEVVRAALVLGLIEDYSLTSVFKVERLLKERLAGERIVKRKEGESRSSPAFYAAVL